MSYKRNQIEAALSRLFDPKSKAVRAELRTRIRRVFELDRFEQAKYAFFSDDAPGTGADISFSEYDAFAQINGTWVHKKS